VRKEGEFIGWDMRAPPPEKVLEAVPLSRLNGLLRRLAETRSFLTSLDQADCHSPVGVALRICKNTCGFTHHRVACVWAGLHEDWRMPLVMDPVDGTFALLDCTHHLGCDCLERLSKVRKGAQILFRNVSVTGRPTETKNVYSLHPQLGYDFEVSGSAICESLAARRPCVSVSRTAAIHSSLLHAEDADVRIEGCILTRHFWNTYSPEHYDETHPQNRVPPPCRPRLTFEIRRVSVEETVLADIEPSETGASTFFGCYVGDTLHLLDEALLALEESQDTFAVLARVSIFTEGVETVSSILPVIEIQDILPE
jgi:hypothetical protein